MTEKTDYYRWQQDMLDRAEKAEAEVRRLEAITVNAEDKALDRYGAMNTEQAAEIGALKEQLEVNRAALAELRDERERLVVENAGLPTTEEAECALKALVPYRDNRVRAGKPTGIVDGLIAKLQQITGAAVYVGGANEIGSGGFYVRAPGLVEAVAEAVKPTKEQLDEVTGLLNEKHAGGSARVATLADLAVVRACLEQLGRTFR